MNTKKRRAAWLLIACCVLLALPGYARAGETEGEAPVVDVSQAVTLPGLEALLKKPAYTFVFMADGAVIDEQTVSPGDVLYAPQWAEGTILGWYTQEGSPFSFEAGERAIGKDDIFNEETVLTAAVYTPKPEATQTPAPTPRPQPRVTVSASFGDYVRLGEEVTLTAQVVGIENPSFQWEVDSGAGFEPVPGATESAYTFVATRENMSYAWRVRVTE